MTAGFELRTGRDQAAECARDPFIPSLAVTLVHPGLGALMACPPRLGCLDLRAHQATTHEASWHEPCHEHEQSIDIGNPGTPKTSRGLGGRPLQTHASRFSNRSDLSDEKMHALTHNAHGLIKKRRMVLNILILGPTSSNRLV